MGNDGEETEWFLKWEGRQQHRKYEGDMRLLVEVVGQIIFKKKLCAEQNYRGNSHCLYRSERCHQGQEHHHPKSHTKEISGFLVIIKLNIAR